MSRFRQFRLHELLTTLQAEVRGSKRKNDIQKLPIYLADDPEGNAFGELFKVEITSVGMILWPMNKRAPENIPEFTKMAKEVTEITLPAEFKEGVAELKFPHKHEKEGTHVGEKGK